ncbi:MAG: hypothetical protein ABMB14_06485 [Myxococcota bacterium]
MSRIGAVKFALIALGVLAGCGDKWQPGLPPHTTAFLLECEHAASSCESCHPADEPIARLDTACISCHVEDRPESHDPAETNNCAECHVGSCDWQGAGSPHPEGFAEGAAHGLTSKLQNDPAGDCRDCHGADLRGGTTPEGTPASGCDDCHAENEAPEWRTDCVFCHGGENGDTTGAPPADIDFGLTELSFEAHIAHVDTSPDYRTLTCVECHDDHNDVMTPNHMFDDTPGVSEVHFDRSIAEITVWDSAGKTCTNNYCHGTGSRDDGTAHDDGQALDCESCHATEKAGWQTMSGLHAAHLDKDGTITCNDCHAAVIDRDGKIATATRHVDGARDVAFFENTITSQDGGGTCSGVCHGEDHDGTGWGHVQDYERADLHGLDSNLQVLDCGSCHGQNWEGGIAQGCDQCHADEGQPGWRTDCTFCHGGHDATGAPPQDIDDVDQEAQISFGAHPEHTGNSPIGHAPYSCDQCHEKPSNALDQGHAIDGTVRVAEVTLENGTSFEGAYDPISQSCSTMYCHGDGQTPSGTITASSPALTCDSCHSTTTGWDLMSGTHAAHLEVAGVSCIDCHTDVNAAGDDITNDNQHVNRQIDVDLAKTGFDPGQGTCTVSCHDQDHTGLGWSGNHPPGFDDPLVHGQEALLRLQDCATSGCHGTDLRGGTGDSCDSCHPAGWRSDCTYCHGGLAGDTLGMPPEDIDNEADETRISFEAHPEHVNTAIADGMACEDCHDSAGYTDAPTDPGHWLVDSTATVAEVRFSGIGAGTVYAANNCSNNYCHGNGQVNGSQADSSTSLDCNGCHSYDRDLTDMSGTHALHLGEAGVSCADCHTDADASGVITRPSQHVNEAIDIDLAATGWNAGAETCTVTCHSHVHNGMGWTGGHPPGFDDPLVHGQEALFQTQDCATSGCHGTDLSGGASGQGCDSCHTNGWRSDCNFCHGTSSTGMPPSDLDNTTSESQITFMAHPQHGDNDEHPLYACSECHGNASDTYDDAFLDAGHWLDNTPGLAEVDFDGLASGGSYNRNTSTCSGNYCHGDGRSDGSQSDSNNSLSCTSCHDMPPNSGEHGEHDNYSCYECHNNVVNSSEQITSPNRHVDGNVDAVMRPGNGINWNGNTCNGTCHESHNNDNW